MAKHSIGTHKGTSHGAKDGARLPTAKELVKLRVVGLNGDWRCACGRRYEAEVGCDNCRILPPCRLYLFEKCPHGSACSHPHPAFDLSAQHFVSPTDEAQAAKALVRPSKLEKALARLRRKQHGQQTWPGRENAAGEQQEWGRESGEGGGLQPSGHSSLDGPGVLDKLGDDGVWEGPWGEDAGYEGWACSGDGDLWQAAAAGGCATKAVGIVGEGELVQPDLDAASKATRKKEENRKRNERRRKAQAEGKQQGGAGWRAAEGAGGPEQGGAVAHGDSRAALLGADGMAQKDSTATAHPASTAGANWAALLSTEAVTAAGPAAEGAAGGAWATTAPSVWESQALAQQESCLSVASQEASGMHSTRPVGLGIAAAAAGTVQGGNGGEDEELLQLLSHLGIEPASEQAAATATQPPEALAAAVTAPAAAATHAIVQAPVSTNVQARPAGKYTPLGMAAMPPAAASIASAATGPATAAAPASTPPSALRPAAVAAALHEEPSSPDSQGQCVVCWDAPAQTVLAPCGHQVLCVDCARTVLGQGPAKTCPMCREEVREYVVLATG